MQNFSNYKTLVVNLIRTVASTKFICSCWRNPWCDCHVTNTPKCSESAKMLEHYYGTGT